MINWQLSKRVFADHYHLTVPRAQVSTRRGRVFFEVIRWQITKFKWSQAQVYFFQWFKYVVFMSLWPRTIRIVISNWPRTRKFSQFFKKYRRGRPFLTMVTRWSRSTSNFYALIGQNLTGEFMRKIHALSWKLFTLTAEADRVLFQLGMFLTVFSLRMYKLKYSCYQESSIYSWLLCLLGFWLRNTSLVEFSNSISDGIVFVFHLA